MVLGCQYLARQKLYFSGIPTTFFKNLMWWKFFNSCSARKMPKKNRKNFICKTLAGLCNKRLNESFFLYNQHYGDGPYCCKLCCVVWKCKKEIVFMDVRSRKLPDPPVYIVHTTKILPFSGITTETRDMAPTNVCCSKNMFVRNEFACTGNLGFLNINVH